MIDIRLTQLCKYIEAEAKKLGDKLFLNRNEAWGRDYGSTQDAPKEINRNPAFVGGERKAL